MRFYDNSKWLTFYWATLHYEQNMDIVFCSRLPCCVDTTELQGGPKISHYPESLVTHIKTSE